MGNMFKGVHSVVGHWCTNRILNISRMTANAVRFVSMSFWFHHPNTGRKSYCQPCAIESPVSSSSRTGANRCHIHCCTWCLSLGLPNRSYYHCSFNLSPDWSELQKQVCSDLFLDNNQRGPQKEIRQMFSELPWSASHQVRSSLQNRTCPSLAISRLDTSK